MFIVGYLNKFDLCAKYIVYGVNALCYSPPLYWCIVDRVCVFTADGTLEDLFEQM